jgi:hypothetical protein
MTTDLDQSGNGYQQIRVYLGPSLGWQMVRVKPQTMVTVAGTYSFQAGDSILLVNVAGLVTIPLPSVARWVKETAYNPATGFERAIYIKDLGGNAATFNITVTPDGADKIDSLAQSFTIVQNRQLLRLYPLNSLDGWFSG